MSKQLPPAPTASALCPCPTIIQISRTPRHWKLTQHHRTTRSLPTSPGIARLISRFSGHSAESLNRGPVSVCRSFKPSSPWHSKRTGISSIHICNNCSELQTDCLQTVEEVAYTNLSSCIMYNPKLCKQEKKHNLSKQTLFFRLNGTCTSK